MGGGLSFFMNASGSLDKFFSFGIPLGLVFFVYLFIFAQASSFENTWMHPEMSNLKEGYLKTGARFVRKDFFDIWDWRITETVPRTTRWLSWYMDFLDTKFRVWLWQRMPPHPSFSLTWAWTLAINPWLLYTYLRLRHFTVSIALTVMAFYLMTPQTLSGIFMLFRSGKILADFFILAALVLACLCEAHPRKKIYFIGFCVALLLAPFSDETGLFIFPFLCLLHPKVVFRLDRGPWVLMVMVLVAWAYAWGIKAMCHFVSGAPLSGLSQYGIFSHLFEPGFAGLVLSNLWINTTTLFTQTMGIGLLHPLAVPWMKVLMVMGVLSWSVLFFLVLTSKELWRMPRKTLLLGGMLFLIATVYHDLLMTLVKNQTWGPYYYGNYFSILFSITLAFGLELVASKVIIRYLWMGIILCLMGQTFLYTNKIYKKNHFYPYNPMAIKGIFTGRDRYFDPAVKAVFSDQQLRAYVHAAWASPSTYRQWRIPEELFWLVVEFNSFKKGYNTTHCWHVGNKFYFVNDKT